MTYQGVFVDDQEDVWAETLSTPTILQLTFQEVKEVALLARSIMAQDPLIVAIDYRLDEVSTNLPTDQAFKGSALAQHLRDASIERPDRDFALVLVSAERKIKLLYRPDKTAHDLFDRVYVKEEINKNRDMIRVQLISLCAGYEKLRACNGSYDLIDLMAGSDEDRPYVDAQELRTKLKDATAPHVASRIMLSLIDRAGPLLDIENVCAFLGIDPGDGSDITAILSEAGISYNGLYSEAWPRWWTNRLEKWALAQFKRRPTGLPASDRARIISEATGKQFSPARSPWNKSDNELISFACACCRRGAELRHSVAAFDQALPRYTSRRRICWDCIQTDKFERADPPFSIDDTDRDVAERVKGLDRTDDSGGAQL